MKPLLTSLLAALTLTACATPAAPPAPQAAPPAPQAAPPAPPPAEAASGSKLPPPIPAIPYPKLNPQDQIDRLGIQISRLQQQIDLLNSRVQQLERRSTAPSVRTSRSAPVTRRTNTSSISAADSAQAAYMENTAERTLSQAQAQFRSGNYREAANILRSSESGGVGNDTDRQSMFLLMQSHLKLGNCESAINIGNRLITRFRSSREAPEALIGIGQCQYRMQQKDIARDTWRKLIQTYPESSAAKRAVELLKK